MALCIGNFTPDPVFASFMKLSHPQPYLVIQNKRYTSDPIGRRLLLTRKSSISIILFPPIENPAQSVIPSTQGTARRISRTPLIRTDFFKEIPHISLANWIIFWNTAMIVENAANDMNRKNRAPQILPPAISRNTFGSVTNTSHGPCPGFTSNAKQDGNMIRPATSATTVSRTVMLIASPVNLLSFPI